MFRGIFRRPEQETHCQSVANEEVVAVACRLFKVLLLKRPFQLCFEKFGREALWRGVAQIADLKDGQVLQTAVPGWTLKVDLSQPSQPKLVSFNATANIIQTDIKYSNVSNGLETSVGGAPGGSTPLPFPFLPSCCY